MNRHFSFLFRGLPYFSPYLAEDSFKMFLQPFLTGKNLHIKVCQEFFSEASLTKYKFAQSIISY